jgi:hypothetical protein
LSPISAPRRGRTTARSSGEKLLDLICVGGVAMSGLQDAPAGVAEHASAAAVREQLCALVSEQGIAVVEDRRRCRNLIRDYCTSDRGAANILIAALDEDIPADLRKPDAARQLERPMESLRQRLKANRGQTDGAARWAVESWALALGSVDASRKHESGTADDVTKSGVAGVFARWSWKRPAAPWAAALAVFVLATAAYGIFGLESAAEKERMSAMVTQLQSSLDEKKIFPAAKMSVTVGTRSLRNKDGSKMDIELGFDGTSGQASGTETDAGSQPKAFQWHLTLTDILTELPDGMGYYILRSNSSDRSFVVLHVDEVNFSETLPDENFLLPSLRVCRTSLAYTNYCFD